MLLLGHLGITLFMGSILGMSLLFLAIGVLLPDIIDKGFYILGLLPCGRSLAHNIFFGPIVAGLVFVITRKK